MILPAFLALALGADAVGPPFPWKPGGLPALAPTAALAGFDDYAARTGWARTDSVSAFGSIAGRDGPLAVHWEVPPGARGTVLLVHGYMDHSGLLSDAAAHLAGRGWAVAAPDLPGHGLSGGARGDIPSFDAYGRALEAVLDTLEARGAPRPWVAVGHSTGGSALLALVTAGERRLERVALVAPLVRMRSAGWVRAGIPLAELATDGIDRSTKRRSTHDSAWHARMVADPLELRRIPLGWVRAALAWEVRADSIQPGNTRWLLVQGDADHVVEGPAGRALLERRLPGLRSVVVPGGRHHLLNEGRPWRARTWSAIDDFLQNSTIPFPSRVGKGTLEAP